MNTRRGQSSSFIASEPSVTFEVRTSCFTCTSVACISCIITITCLIRSPWPPSLSTACAAAELASTPFSVISSPCRSSSSSAFSTPSAVVAAASYSSISDVVTTFSLSAAHMRKSKVSMVASSSFLSRRASRLLRRATMPWLPPKVGRESASVSQHASISFARPAVVESRQSPPSGSSGRMPCNSIAAIAVSADCRLR